MFLDNYEIRIFGNSENLLFIAKDICDVLGYAKADRALVKLDDDEKGTQILRTPGGEQKMSVINESGLYTLILCSNKPEAKKFKRWVTGEVLPAIRKQGMYVKEIKKAELGRESISSAIENLQEIMVSTFFNQQISIECLSNRVEQLVKQIEATCLKYLKMKVMKYACWVIQRIHCLLRKIFVMCLGTKRYQGHY